MEVTLFTLDKAAEALEADHAKFNTLALDLQRQVREIELSSKPKIRRAQTEVLEKTAALKAQIEIAPHLFERPKTMVLHNVKLGWQKGKGGITYGDPEAVVRLIEKHFPDQFDLLVHVKKCPNKEGLAKLDAVALKRLGCEIVAAGEQIVIRPLEGELDKLVRALVDKILED